MDSRAWASENSVGFLALQPTQTSSRIAAPTTFFFFSGYCHDNSLMRIVIHFVYAEIKCTIVKIYFNDYCKGDNNDNNKNTNINTYTDKCIIFCMQFQTRKKWTVSQSTNVK